MYPDFAIVKAVILMSLPVLCLLWISVRMFCTLGLALAMHFEEIATQIDNVSLHLPNLKERLNEWSVAHSLVCNAIRQLEEYFGNVLLLSVCCIFTGSTNFAVFFYDKKKNSREYKICCEIFPFTERHLLRSRITERPGKLAFRNIREKSPEMYFSL